MELPDITQLTEQQWDQLVASIQQAKVAKALLKEQEVAALRAEIAGSVGAINALIGPENPPIPSFDSIRGLRKFTRQQMHDNAGWAIEVILEYMEKIALVIRDVAQNESN